MKFCEKDGAILLPKREGKEVYLVCPKCGSKYDSDGKIELSEKIVNNEDVEVFGEKDNSGAMIEVECEKCGHNKAYFTIVQTRSSDEAPTRIYKCEKCGNVWREYD